MSDGETRSQFSLEVSVLITHPVPLKAVPQGFRSTPITLRLNGGQTSSLQPHCRASKVTCPQRTPFESSIQGTELSCQDCGDGTVFPIVGNSPDVTASVPPFSLVWMVGTVQFPRATIMGAIPVGKAAKDLLCGFPSHNVHKGQGLAQTLQLRRSLETEAHQ